MEYDQYLSSLMILDEQNLLDFTPFISETNTSNEEFPIIPSLDSSFPVQQSLEDIEFESLTIWDDMKMITSCCEDVVVSQPLIMPLNMASNDINIACVRDEEKMINESITLIGSRTSKIREIEYDELKKYFYMPIASAAKAMNVGLTVLKKRCRELGITRWPHRKMKSLNSLIHNVKEFGKDEGEEILRRELNTLEEERRLMEENPEMELNERTKRLRQACFKANYKKRKAMQLPCSYRSDIFLLN
ncbi:protein RKD4 [Dioscorea cayenensis subsp. rotundata]|uniref:Protein RKD4 n=1 Tax=Dioscorea cayennensis subsp. rotundata TaxID=55577 RepID=A0AB40ALW5_DIOCR|nr:protein RKD4 [Dioscorea cayenensis subsp. rotundata]